MGGRETVWLNKVKKVNSSAENFLKSQPNWRVFSEHLLNIQHCDLQVLLEFPFAFFKSIQSSKLGNPGKKFPPNNKEENITINNHKKKRAFTVNLSSTMLLPSPINNTLMPKINC